MEGRSYPAKTTLLENGDVLLEFPEDLISHIGWKEGDVISIGLDPERRAIIMSKVSDAE